jgi:hypothetical protein
MPRKAKLTPGEACALHLCDLRRKHGRPPADVPVDSDRPGIVAPRAERASGSSSALAWDC